MSNTPQTPRPPRSAGKPIELGPLQLTVDPASVEKLIGLFRDAIEPLIENALSRVPSITPQQPAEKLPAPSQTKGLELGTSTQLKAADLRMSLLTGKVPEDVGLLVDSKTFAKLLDISLRTLARLHSEAALPKPVSIGNLKKWRLTEILEWIEADCPPQKVWEIKKEASIVKKRK